MGGWVPSGTNKYLKLKYASTELLTALQNLEMWEKPSKRNPETHTFAGVYEKSHSKQKRVAGFGPLVSSSLKEKYRQKR